MSFMVFFLMKYFYMILNLTIIKKDNIMIKNCYTTNIGVVL